ncbi:hypothetical protein ASD65_03375 [Microbacterium sp. Root61]|uniref:TetR family transcriptional regulator n=1 Tax=Microbacterium sp. Root61 TaxID=1736570 RepID=UPI0006F33372|nr:TetR family transcriptional regulator [Microbacterium sp. Root61]KRA23569.1 hypothetical protein ASD65_03375 [Microbacterium sp. Root61]
MTTTPRSGRPRASSREVLAEAACELFLERGYDATSIVDITTRAGVSRSSFFNYFASKGDILWAGLDERIADAEAGLRTAPGHADAAVRQTLGHLVAGFAPDVLALALANAPAMGIEDELERETALRRARLGRMIAGRFRAVGVDAFRADVSASAYAGALMAAIEHWALAGPGRTSLADMLGRALASVTGGGNVRQLRVVVHAEDFEGALTFYRDTLGMPQADAFEADGGARVVILDAGRATLELANSAQVRFIDTVETDGVASEPIRLAIEVDDTLGTVERLADGGAVVEASARETPWRSLNARLRAPANVQLTVFQELGPA